METSTERDSTSSFAALPRIKRRLAGLRLHVAGSDPAKKKIARLAEELGVADCVEWHGRVPADRALAMIHGCDAFVMPSRREALGLVYLEAFRAAVPVVSGHEGGVSEVVRDEVTGLCASTPQEIAEAVLRLNDDSYLRSRLVSAGLEAVKARTPARLVEESVEAYERITEAKSCDAVSTSKPHKSIQDDSSNAASPLVGASSTSVCDADPALAKRRDAGIAQSETVESS